MKGEKGQYETVKEGSRHGMEVYHTKIIGNTGKGVGKHYRKGIPCGIMLLMFLLIIFAIYVHVIRPASTVLEIIYLVRMVKASKLDNLDYYLKGIDYFCDELNQYFMNNDIFSCLQFDLDTRQPKYASSCSDTQIKETLDKMSEIIDGYANYKDLLCDLKARLEEKGDFPDELEIVNNGIKYVENLTPYSDWEMFINMIAETTEDKLSFLISFYEELTRIQPMFNTLEDKITNKNIKKGLRIVGYLIIFLLPLPIYLIEAIPLIYYQDNVFSQIFSTIFAIVEVFMNFPLTFLYPNSLYSVYLFEQRGFEQLLANNLIFFPTVYLMGVCENIRQIIDCVYFFICAYLSYDEIKENYLDNFTKHFLMIMMALSCLRFIMSLFLVFLGCCKSKYLENLIENRKKAKLDENNSDQEEASEKTGSKVFPLDTEEQKKEP